MIEELKQKIETLDSDELELLNELLKNKDFFDCVDEIHFSNKKDKFSAVKKLFDDPSDLLGNWIDDSDIENYAKSNLDLVDDNDVTLNDITPELYEIEEYVGGKIVYNKDLVDDLQLESLMEWFDNTHYLERENIINNLKQ